MFAGLLFVASVLNYIDRQTLSVLAVTIERALHLSDIRYGYVVQYFLGAYMVMYVLSGRIVERLGARKSQALFLLAWSVADGLTGFVSGFSSLAGCRALLGLAEPGNYTASLRSVSDWFSARQRAIAVGIYSMGGTVGAAIALPLTSTLALRFGWRSAFVVTGAIGILVSLLWLLLYRDPPSSAGRRAMVVPWRVIVRTPYIAELLIVRMMTDVVWYFFLFWIPMYMQEKRGLSLRTIGMTLWVLYVAADVGSFSGGFLSSRFVRAWGPVRARLYVMVPAAACMTLLSVIPSLSTVSAILALLSGLALCHMAWMTNITTMTIDLFPHEMAASVQGMIGAGSAAGGLLSAGLIAHTLQHHGYRPVFLLLALLHPSAAAILLIRLRPVMKRGAQIANRNPEVL